MSNFGINLKNMKKHLQIFYNKMANLETASRDVLDLLGKHLRAFLVKTQIVIASSRKTTNQNLLEMTAQMNSMVSQSGNGPDSIIVQKLMCLSDIITNDIQANLQNSNIAIEFMKTLAYAYKVIHIANPNAGLYYSHFENIISILKNNNLWVLN
jgi:hypothetical protein